MTVMILIADSFLALPGILLEKGFYTPNYP